MDFRYFLLDSKRKLLLLPSTSHTVEWMNLELLTLTTRHVHGELKFGTRACDIQSTIEIKRGEKKWWNVSYRVTTVSQRKFERSRQEVVRFVVSSSNGNPLDILQIAYRTWERSTLFWNIFIPSKSKENPKTLSRNTCLNWKIFDIERVTCSRNILRKRKRKKKNETKIIKYFSLETKDCTFLKINGLTSRSCTCCTWRYYFWMKCRSSTISFISNLDREVLLWMLKHH